MSSNSANQNNSNSGHQLGIRIGKQPTASRSLSLTAARRQRASTNGNRPSSAGSASSSSSVARTGNGGGGASLRRKRPGSSSGRGASSSAPPPPAVPNSTAADDPQTRLESLTLHLSSLEAQRDAKRTRLQALGDQMQKIRSRMKTLEEELQGLDGDIDDVEGQVRRLARSAGAGQGGGGGGGGRSDADIDSQTQTLQYASTQLSPTQAEGQQSQSSYPPEQDFGEEVHENLDGDHQQDTCMSAAAANAGNGYVGSMQDVGTQDMNNDEEEEEDNATQTAATTATATATAGLASPQGYGRTLAPPDEMLTDPPASSPGGGKFGRASNALTMNPDEVLTEPVPPTQGEPIPHTGGIFTSTAGRSAHQQNDDEMDMIANHYDDFEDEEQEAEGMHGMPPPEDDFYYQHNGAGGEQASTFDIGGYAAAGAAAGTSVDHAFESTTTGTTNDYHTFGADARPGSRDSDVIELGTVYHADPPAAMVPSGGGSNRGGGTLDSYFARTGSSSPAGGRQQTTATRRDATTDGGVLAHATSATAFDAPSAAASFASSHSNRPTREDRNASYMHRLARDTFPWSREMDHHLRHTFRIQSFRENKKVINASMSGDDVMVLMRTGGGKSEFLLEWDCLSHLIHFVFLLCLFVPFFAFP